MNPSAPDPGQRPGLVGWALGLPLAAILLVVFVLVPIGFAFFLGKAAYDWLDARSWQPVEAVIESADLRRERDADHNAVLQVKAVYRYRWNGVEYRSDRVDLHHGADNIGDDHQRMYDRLAAALAAGAPVTAWVDPDNPAAAVLDRDMRRGQFALLLLFPLLFGGAGALIFTQGRQHRYEQRQRARFRRTYPDQPWRWDTRWRTAELHSRGRPKMWQAIGFAVFWNAISAPVLFLVPKEIAGGNWPALAALVFPLAGLGLAVWALRKVVQHRRYGDSVLVLDSLPVPLGGLLRATLTIPARLAVREVTVQLACMHKQTTGSGKQRRTTERLLWEDRHRFMTRPGPGQTSVRIEMNLPAGQPASSEDDPNDRIVWRLEAFGEEKGIDYRAEFELPVFDSGAAPNPAAGLAAVNRPKRQYGADDWRETGVEHGYVAGGQRFYFPRFRVTGTGLGTLLFALVFLGAGIGLTMGTGQWVFGVVFVSFGLLILWAALTMLFSLSEIVAGGGRLRWRHGLFGGWRDIEAGAIERIGVKRSGSIGRNLYFRIEIKRWGNRRESTIADWVPNERATRSLVLKLGQLIGLDADSV